ncbi:uncharacterized protein LOC121800120 [Salvia splendens]|uniref:uncharacterized protein LOC121800120 n=1 Tax=Salvia splendens TaxID=180675 RepID=UPI001C27FDAB|nr:uncharacterized protein LOC121800120 [Salvia splendens]
MAVAGMHNVSAFGPFFLDSQTSVSRQWSDEPGTRASSLLKMWRELEGDHVASPSYRSRGQRIARRSDNEHECDISEDAYDTEAPAVRGSEIDHDDNNSIVSGQSSDLGELERARVRQIFQEWMNSGSIGRSPNGFHLSNCSGPQWLGKNDTERVRFIREWGQTNSQQRNNQALVRDGGAEVVSRIEQVREGMAVSHCETTACRPIRRLCGRQTLLELLQRAQCERKAELQGLLEHRPVSNFTHRNRIQALLRGRFLRNETMIPDIRPSSVAARELGLLRQQHTVSGLREGFLSKLEKSASTSTSSTESDSWLSDQNHSKLESTFQEREIATNSAIPDLESDADRHGNLPEFGREVTAVGKQAMHDSGNEEDVSSGNKGHVQEVSSYIDVSQRDVPCDVGSVDTTEGKVLEGKATEQMSTAEGAGIIRGRGEITVTISNEISLETDTLHSLYESGSGVSYDEETAAHTVDLEGNVDEQFDRPVDSATDIEEWVDTSGESMARIWQETSCNE